MRAKAPTGQSHSCFIFIGGSCARQRHPGLTRWKEDVKTEGHLHLCTPLTHLSAIQPRLFPFSQQAGRLPTSKTESGPELKPAAGSSALQHLLLTSDYPLRTQQRVRPGTHHPTYHY